MTATQKIQKRCWEFLYPVFPLLEGFLNPLRFRRRQPFLLGWLHPGRSLEDLRKHLHREWGFEHVVPAWTDDGQVLSWRKRISFEYQYHVRVFGDGEIRGHFEYTPEAAPLKHFFEIGQEMRAEEFRRFLADHMVDYPDVSAAARGQNTNTGVMQDPQSTS